MRGIRIVYDPSLGIGRLGRALAEERGWVIRVGPYGMTTPYEALNTLAHELNHAHDLIRNDFFRITRVAEPNARDAGNAAEDWARGLR